MTYVSAEGDFDAAAAEAIFPDEEDRSVSGTELPVLFTRGEARRVVERWHAEARVARDTVKFALPPSQRRLGAGDVITLAGDAEPAPHYRIDSVEQGADLLCEAVRVEPRIYLPGDMVEEHTLPTVFRAPAPVRAVFLDLPLLTGDEVEHAPHVALSGVPWPGQIAVYSAASDNAYVNDMLVDLPSVLGQTQTPLIRAEAGVWDRGSALRVRMARGDLETVEPEALFAGANAMAIGDGSPDNWEIFQFAEATLVGADTYELKLRLRGQLGTDALMPDVWPVGSLVVLLDGALEQLPLASSHRGLERHYRIGPASRSIDDDSFVHTTAAFDGIGLRPYAPVHLRADATGGATSLTWVRRSRIDGDSWAASVPLGETSEAYRVRVIKDDIVIREDTTSTSNWTYSAAAQASDGITNPYAIDVAQISDRFGPGLARRIEIDD